MEGSVMILKADLLSQIFSGMALIGRILCKRFFELLPKENRVVLTLQYTNELRDSLGHCTRFLKSFHHLELSLQLNSGENSICRLPKGELDNFIRQTSTLTSLDIRKNGLGRWGGGSESLFDLLVSTPQLRKLHAGDNELGPTGALHLAMGILYTPLLISLDLSHDKLGDDGMTNLVPGLCSTILLTEVSLCRNGISAAGAAQLAKAMAHLTLLKSLNIAENILGSAGALQLAVGLIRASQITSLRLGWNGIGAAGAASFLHPHE